MPKDDSAAARRARAKKLREQIRELKQPAPGAPPPPPVESPGAFVQRRMAESKKAPKPGRRKPEPPAP